ncbi:hypothetical protein, partial [Mycobacterium tuberculosis]|uniref:hypothetical protein n=1 Tax=Mycobacterium tuberculosis TaxID=1773 RepID=UPI001BE09EBD
MPGAICFAPIYQRNLDGIKIKKGRCSLVITSLYSVAGHILQSLLNGGQVYMIEHVKYTHCDKLLHTAEEIEKNESILCHQTGIKKKGSYDCFYALAYKLRNQSQIPHKYFEIESLLLYNVSLSSDPNRYQEYAVYKRAEDDSYTKVESITVNGPSSVSNLARILMSIN